MAARRAWRLTVATGALAAALLSAPAPTLAQSPPIYRAVSYGPSPNEIATIYSQTNPGATAVILVHGGGWRLQKLVTEQGSVANSLYRQGFVVFDINYEQDSPTEPAFPLETGDVMAATEWAIAHAATYGANPANVVMLGGSAGAQLVSRAAEQLDVAAPGTVRAVAELSGPMNFQTLVADAIAGAVPKAYVKSIGQALGCPSSLTLCAASFEAEWSPALNVPTSGCPDWLLITSETEPTDRSQSEEMLTALQGAGCRAELNMQPTGHGFSYWSAVARSVAAFFKAE